MAIAFVREKESGSVERRVKRLKSGVWRVCRYNSKATVGALILLLFIVLAVFPGQIAPYSPTNGNFRVSLPPSSAHWLGTTTYGQDVLSQLIWSTRQSLIVGFAAGGLATGLSVIMGLSAGYLGGMVDGGLSLVTDVLLVIPVFPLIVVIAAYVRSESTGVMILVLGLIGWSYGARQLRVQVRSMRSRDFIDAARVRGERSVFVIIVEILPSMTSLIIATFLSSAIYAILAATGLQFIGLGNANAQSWGTMLYFAENNDALSTGMALWAIMPGLCVALLGGGLALLSYAFDEVSNPALRRQSRGHGRTVVLSAPVSGDVSA